MTEQITAVREQRDPALDQIAPTVREDLRTQPLLIPIPKAARILGISRSAAYRCAASGELPTRHLGGRVYVVTDKLRDLLESA
jgi:predicted DNA-binding transcriptional regulator AlpA